MSFNKLTVLTGFLALGLPLAATLANPQRSSAASPCPGVESRPQSPNSNAVDESLQEDTSLIERSPTQITGPLLQPDPPDEVVTSTDTPPRTLDEIDLLPEIEVSPQPLLRQERESPSSDEF
jgi:hypothetical protein